MCELGSILSAKMMLIVMLMMLAHFLGVSCMIVTGMEYAHSVRSHVIYAELKL